MGQNEIKAAIDGAVEYLTSRPDEARYTDSPAVARLTSLDGLRTDVTGPNGAQLTTDMPTSVGGTNTTASPGWYLRAAEASCVATLIAMRAARLGVRLTDLEVTVDSESNDWGILGIGDISAGPMSTRIAVRIRGGEGGEGGVDTEGYTAHDLHELVNWAVEHCPVTDAVRRAIPMNIEVDAG